LVIGLPAGFVGAVECKAQLRKCIQVPRLTNTGPKGGALWAAAVLNALLLEALNRLVEHGGNSPPVSLSDAPAQ
jgi:precorrin-8X/cobalt-precorrin-8 methylmutase